MIDANNQCSLTTVISDGCTPETSQTPEMSMTDLGCVAGPSFTEEQRRRFQLRYEEGFDVPGDVVGPA